MSSTNETVQDSVMIEQETTQATESQALVASPTPVSLTIENLLNEPTLANLERYYPDMVPVVEKMMAEIDPTDHMALVNYGADALEDMAEAGLDVFRTFQDSSWNNVSSDVTKIYAEFKGRAAALQEQLDKNAEVRRYLEKKKKKRDFITPDGKMGSALTSRLGEGSAIGRVLEPLMKPLSVIITTVAENVTKITDPSGEKARERREKKLSEEISYIDQIAQCQDEDGKLLLEACQKAVDDFAKMRLLLEASSNKPQLIFEQMEKSREASVDARKTSFLRLIALNEVHAKTNKEIEETHAAAQENPLTADEVETLDAKKRGLKLIERRATDFVGTITIATSQIEQAKMLQNVTADAALEISRQALQVSCTIASNISVIKGQHETVKLMTILENGNRMQEESTKATAMGMKILLKRRAEADEARVKANHAIAAAAQQTAQSIIKLQDQEKKHEVNLRASRKDMEKSVKDLLRVTGSKKDFDSSVAATTPSAEPSKPSGTTGKPKNKPGAKNHKA